MTLDIADAELLKKLERLPDKDRAEVLRRVKVKQGSDIQIWYCSCSRRGCDGSPHDEMPFPHGRKCNGRPHAGVPYEHARSDQWPPAGTKWDVWFYMSGRGTGKALSLDTPLPTLYSDSMMRTTEQIGTPTGWIMMGEVQVGDVLLDEMGRPTTVTAVFEPEVRKAYRVHFSDGSHLDACEDHLWVTHSHLERKAHNRGRARGDEEAPWAEGWASKKPISTAELFRTKLHNGVRNHSIPLAAPLDLPEQPLLVAPWVLGYWLGNGSRGEGVVTAHPDDEAEVRAELLRNGYESGHRYADDRAPSFTALGLKVKLRSLGVLEQKHIPAQYLRGSRAQREALFAGLLDSDGYISSKTQGIEITVVHNEKLALQIFELAVSLGQKPVIKTSAAGYSGKVTGTRWRITFRPTFQPFRLQRKGRVWRPPAGQGSRSFQRMIVDVVEIEPVPMRCVTVDSPNSMYLAGRAMIPTHNTKSGGHWTRQMSQFTSRIALVGRRGDDVRTTMVEGESGLIKACEAAGVSYEWRRQSMEFTFENGCMAKGFSAEEPESLRGPEHGAGWLDEPCVAEGELVLLRRGLIPIEQVQVGDEAWTRLGWRRVSAVHDNGIKETYWIHAEGLRVRVTGNHRLAVGESEWVTCDSLSHGSTLVACSHMGLPLGSNGEDAGTTETAKGTTATAADGCSIGTSTKPRSGQSQKVTTSTTSTKTRRTTRPGTSRRSRQQNTTLSLSAPSLPAESTSSRTRTLPSGALGAGQRWRRSGTAVNPALTLASTAEPSSRVEPPTPHTAAFPTESVRVGSVSRAGRVRVYDLTVEEAHEFVAGGLVVHNCHMDLIDDVWLNYSMGLRGKGIPGGAKTLLTSSPLPVQWTKDRIAEKGQVLLDEMGNPRIDPETGKPEREPVTVLVQVPTSVNIHNLDEGYKRRVINPLKGTRKGKQELDAMLLEDVEGALWEAEWLRRSAFLRAHMDRVVVAVDPAGSDAKTADLTGIVTVGRMGERYGVLADKSGAFSPAGWAQAAIDEYDRVSADAIVLERFGGDIATTILRNAKHRDGRKFTGRIIEVKARQGKDTRAEPISGLYEQGLVDHLEGADLADLEDELLTWVPGVTKKSPDHLDALVWGLTELSGKQTKPGSTGIPRGTLPRSIPGRAPGQSRGALPWKR